MADVKISNLPAATTPLAGTEEIPLVQSGVTKKATVDDIVAAAGGVTDVTATSPVISSGGATPNISMPAASGSTSGYLSSTDWTTFNNKGSGTVTSVTGTAPIVSTGGTTPAISMPSATTSRDGYLTSTDWNTFNNKQPAGSYLTSGGALGTPSSGTATNLTGLPLSTGVTGTLPVANGGTGTSTPSLVAGTNVTISGTWPNQTINSTGGGGGSGTVTSVATGTGLTGGPITTSGTISLADTAVTPGTYTAANITVDAQGRITAAANGSGGGGGTVTSVDLSGGTTGLTTSGGPITTSGSITLAGTLVVANGGTGATTASGARTNLGAAASGANSDITSMSGITGAIGTADYVAFDTTYSTTLTAGQLGWDGNNTLGLGMAGGNVVQRIGEDEFYYIKASSAITKGQVVMFTGSVGASGVVTGAPATGVTDGSYIMGVAAESMALNGFGLVQFQGTLRGIDTSAFADGNILWYNPSVTGGLTATKPSAPNVKVQIAAVIYASNGGSGSILIRVDPGSVLGGTDSNVQFGTLTNGNLIQYNSTGGYWENVTPGSITVGNVSGTVAIANGGTGQTTQQAAINALAAATTSGYYLRGNGTNVVMAAIQAADVPTLNQNTTGTAAGLSTTLAVASGGTGATSLTANNVILGNGTSAVQVVAPGTSGNVLTSNGTTWVSSTPAAQSYPGSGIAVSTGSAWTTSLTAPSGALVGTTDSQTLTNKTVEAGTFTNGYTEEVATANTSTAYTIDLANGSVQILTLTGNCTFTFPTATAGKSFMLLLQQDATGSRTVTWPASVKWPSGTAPTITSTASKGDKYVFTADGTYWWGSTAGQNYL